MPSSSSACMVLIPLLPPPPELVSEKRPPCLYCGHRCGTGGLCRVEGVDMPPPDGTSPAIIMRGDTPAAATEVKGMACRGTSVFVVAAEDASHGGGEIAATPAALVKPGSDGGLGVSFPMLACPSCPGCPFDAWKVAVATEEALSSGWSNAADGMVISWLSVLPAAV